VADKKYLTTRVMRDTLKRLNVVIKYNVISNKIAITGLPNFITDEHSESQLPVYVKQNLKLSSVKDFSDSDIAGHLANVALENQFNPVLDLIRSVVWDEKDRINEVYDIFCIDSNDKLSQTLIKKWLMQCYALANNTESSSEGIRAFGADGVLNLVGPQGLGKTSALRTLAMSDDFFLEGESINPDNKDSVIQATSVWICELGEIGSTMRSNVDHLKAFLTRQIDKFRKPYGRTYLSIARKTSFCASCNDPRYLLDETGNRRFWTVPVVKIKLEKVLDWQNNPNEVLQLWAQVADIVKRDGLQSFRLTKDEQSNLA